MEIQPFWTCLFVSIGATLILMQPLLRYVCTGWNAKRKDIMDSLNPKARLSYYLMFGCSEPRPTSAAEACVSFENLYYKWYGRRYFIGPGILLGLTSFTATAAVVVTVLGKGLLASNPLFNIGVIASAALGGAYLWVVNDHIGRARRLDFSPADVMWSVLRIVIAVPMGYAFSTFFKDDLAPFIAFSFGAFPLPGLISLIRRFSEKKLGEKSELEEHSDDLIQLQGVNKTILERLSMEDVSTITQIAYCDPVRLTMRSNLSFNFVIDCMGQALAWMYLTKMLDTLRPFGLRGACEIKYFMDDLTRDGKPEDKAGREAAQLLLVKIAAAVQIPQELLQFAFNQIALDPFTVFLSEIWAIPDGLEGCGDKSAGAGASTNPPATA
jgi:hypothetical protein